MAAASKMEGYVSFRQLSLELGLSHGYISEMYRRGQLHGVEVLRLGNRCLLRRGADLDMMVASLLSREGRPVRFTKENNSARSRAEYLLAVAQGKREATPLDKEISAQVLGLAAYFFEKRQPDEKARLFAAACEFAVRSLTLKRQNNQEAFDLLVAFASALAPQSSPSEEIKTP
jgi:hypothetical protein